MITPEAPAIRPETIGITSFLLNEDDLDIDKDDGDTEEGEEEEDEAEEEDNIYFLCCSGKKNRVRINERKKVQYRRTTSPTFFKGY